MASSKPPLLFLVPTPQSLGPTSLCLCRKIVWVQDKSIFYAFSPLMKTEADQITNFRVPISACVVNGNNLLTSVDGKLVGVQQVLGHVIQPNIQQPVLIEPTQLRQTHQAPTIQTPITISSRHVDNNRSRVTLMPSGQRTDKQLRNASIEITPHQQPSQKPSANSILQGKTKLKNFPVISVHSTKNHTRNTNTNRSSGSNKPGNLTVGHSQLKVKFPWNKTGSFDAYESKYQKPGNNVKDKMQPGKDARAMCKMAHIPNTDTEHVLKTQTTKSNTGPKDIVLQDTAVIPSKQIRESTHTPKMFQMTKSLRVTIPKLNSTSLKRLGCSKSSSLLLDIERKEKKTVAIRSKRGRHTLERPQRLTSLTHHPDFKHIPTTDKISFLKDLLKAQRSYLGL
ncbi:uncharacterized protein [Amphiura filiformis]|uniref:uncharacterized protein n=1 Tax=Amphiura filiformis TaxID=82378 RepID=UPI003B20F97C